MGHGCRLPALVTALCAVTSVQPVSARPACRDAVTSHTPTLCSRSGNSLPIGDVTRRKFLSRPADEP